MMRTCGFLLKDKKSNQIKNDENLNDFIIKKRINQRENEIITKILQTTQHVPNAYGDRFIPRRYVLEENLHKLYISKYKRKRKDIDFIQARLSDGYWRYQNFKITFDRIMSIENERILKFSDSLGINVPIVEDGCRNKIIKLLPPKKCVEIIHKNSERFDWSCKPRSRPYALENSSHDLPQYYPNKDKNVIAWSSKGQITTVFKNKLICCNVSNEDTKVYYLKNITAISYNPQGDFLAIGRIVHQKPVLQLWDIRKLNNLLLFNSYTTFTSKINQHINEIQCIIWDNNGHYLICGYKNGFVEIIDASTLELKKTLIEHKCSIYSMKLSSNMKYLATSDIHGWICIFLWYNLKVHVQIESTNRIPVQLEWHPWNCDELFIAEPFPASINIFYVPTGDIIAFYKRKDNKVRFDSITVNKLTSELFVACTIQNPNGTSSYEVIVLASLEHVVDILKNHTDKIKCMLWSPDNLQLATIGNDDMLTIWNVFSMNNFKFVKHKIKNLNKYEEDNIKTKNYSIWDRISSIR